MSAQAATPQKTPEITDVAGDQNMPDYAAFRRGRDLWQQQVICDAALRPSTKVVAMRLTYYLNLRLGYAFPPLTLLATDLSMSKQGVLNALAQLVAHGHLRIEQGGGAGKANRYRFVSKGDQRDADEVEKGSTPVDCFQGKGSTPIDPLRPENGQHPLTVSDKKGQRQTKKRSTLVDSTPISTPLKRESDPPAPKFNFGESVAQKESRATVPMRRKKKKSDEPDPSFEAWWQIYPLHKSKLGAQRAYAKALASGASPEDLLRGARRYAAERAREPDPVKREKFTAKPHNWLTDGCWTDDPAPQPQPYASPSEGAPAVRRNDPRGGLSFTEINLWRMAEARK